MIRQDVSRKIDLILRTVLEELALSTVLTFSRYVKTCREQPTLIIRITEKLIFRDTSWRIVKKRELEKNARLVFYFIPICLGKPARRPIRLDRSVLKQLTSLDYCGFFHDTSRHIGIKRNINLSSMKQCCQIIILIATFGLY